MLTVEKNRRMGFLEDQSQETWVAALEELAPSIHAVDRAATFVWFAFWPLDLRRALSEPEGRAEVARLMDLEGSWDLAEQVDSSVGFLYGAHHWAAVKSAVLESDDSEKESLAASIRSVASRVASRERVDVSLVLGIAAVGLMVLRQAGPEALERIKDSAARPPLLPKDPARVLAARKRKSSDGIFTFLKGIHRRWEVRWEERAGALFRAINGQDIAMAGAAAEGDFRTVDYRRIAGPVPVECRVGSCGYCWVGVLEGRENLSEMSSFERERLRYFGYDAVNREDDPRPWIRLACQTQCLGDVTLTIPPWNGELDRRHDVGRKKLGTA